MAKLAVAPEVASVLLVVPAERDKEAVVMVHCFPCIVASAAGGVPRVEPSYPQLSHRGRQAHVQPLIAAGGGREEVAQFHCKEGLHQVAPALCWVMVKPGSTGDM